MNKDYVISEYELYDLDNICIDNSERVALATRPDGSMDWEVLFNSQLVHLDKPIMAARAAVQAAARAGKLVWYVTSRPEKMQAATVRWLQLWKFPRPECLFTRPQYDRTPEYKAGVVASLHSEEFPVVLFVDDSEKNRAAVAALHIPGLVIQAGINPPEEPAT